MSKLTSRKTVLAATVAGLAVAGGGTAIAASQADDSPASSFFDAVAEHLGISSGELEDATKAAALDQVDQALDEGRITEEQASELRSHIESGDARGLLGLFGLHGFRHGGPDEGDGFGLAHPVPFLRDRLRPAAEYLGLTEAELFEHLREGKSLAEVAEAEGKSVDGLKQAILDGARSALDEAVANERLTQTQADAIYERLQAVIDELVEGSLPGPRGDRFGPGFSFGFGPPGFAPGNGGDDDGSGGGSSRDVNWETAA